MEEVEEFSLIDIFYRIKKRIILVIAIIVLATLIPLIAGIFFTTPVYESKVGIIAEMPRQDENSRITGITTMYSNLMGTYIAIAKTSFVAEMAAAEMKEITSGELLSSVDVTTDNTSMILYITIVNKNPDIAYKAVNAYTKAFMERSNELLPEGKLTIVDNSAKPTTPLDSNTPINVLIGFTIGVIVAVGLSYYLEEFEIKKRNNKSKISS